MKLWLTELQTLRPELTLTPQPVVSGVAGSKRHFFDVRVFNPSAQSNCATSLQSTYRKHEMEKKRHYEQRVLEVERSSFTPLVMSATGGMRPGPFTVDLPSSVLSEKQGTSYSKTVEWIRCRLSFALLMTAILCICGSRPSKQNRTTKGQRTSKFKSLKPDLDYNFTTY